ncbi:TPR-like protein [Coprinopsis marcescibilis]|uniref:TPR-like protein n=1 Tax=Coprinopsis marcescibilis TaxID=230819 RepID=A0A5C3L8M9_COPMA|nr:TPR-like protein [Coprinopsis marcescibilis]
MFKIVKLRQRIHKWGQNKDVEHNKGTVSKSEAPLKNSPGAQAFTGARDVNLNNVAMSVVGGDMHVTNINHHHNQDSRTDIEIHEAIRRLADPTGCSWDPARTCFAGTRELQINEISSWTQTRQVGPSGAKVLVVADSVGSGKSALAHTVCEHARKQKTFLAGFFFNQMEQQSTPSNMLATLIRGLCNIDDKVKRAIGEILAKDNSLALAQPIQQFEEIILPIVPLLPSDRHFVVVVDALDEERDPVILEILRNWVSRLPPSFRFIVTTRPEQRIMGYLDKQPHVLRFAQGLTGKANQDDVKTFIKAQLENASYGPDVTPELLDAFVAKTEGLFLWAKTVLSHLADTFDPVAELEDIVHGKSSHWQEDGEAAQKLEDLYLRILSKLKWTDRRFVEKYKIIMGALVVIKDSLTPDGLAAIYSQQGITLNDIHRICTLLHPLLQNYSPNNSQQPFRLLHLSVQEYLTQRAPSPYRLESEEHDSTLSWLALNVLKKELNPTNVPILGYSDGDWISNLSKRPPSIPLLLRDAISEQLRYSSQFVGEHTLSMAVDGIHQPHIHLLRDLVFEPRHILEITASLGTVIKIAPLRKRAKELLSDAGFGNEVIRYSAKIYLAIADCLNAAARFGEAYPIAEDTVVLYRQLAKSDHQDSSLEQETAYALEVLAFSLDSLNLREEGIPIAAEGLEIARRLAEEDIETHRPLLARLLHTQGVIYNHLKRHQEALETDTEAVKLYRILYERDEVFGGYLAWSLYNLSAELSACDRTEEALPFAKECVDIWRRRSSNDPDLETNLAHALQIYAVRFTDCDKAQDAIEPGQEAVAIRRKLAATKPDTYEQPLSDALNALTITFSKLGKHTEALEMAEEVVTIRRRLAAKDLENDEATLGFSLTRLSSCLDSCNREEDALRASQESLQIFRRLSQGDPVKFDADLAVALQNKAVYSANLKKYDEALELDLEAIAVNRRLTEQDPKHGQHLASTLHNSASHFELSGRKGEAIAHIKEAIKILRRLVAESPTQFEPDLCNSLHSLGIYLSNSESIDVYREVVEIRTRLALTRPARFNPPLSQSLYNLAWGLSTAGNVDEAMPFIQESIAIRRRLSAEDPASFVAESNLSSSLHGYAIHLTRSRKYEEAIEAEKECISIRTKLAAINPGEIEEGFAESLHNIACDLGKLSRYAEALPYLEQGIEIRRRLAVPATDHLLADSLHNYFIYLSYEDELDKSILFGEEALVVRRRAAAGGDPTRLRELASTLHIQSSNFKQKGRLDDAVLHSEEAISTIRKLLVDDPTTFEPLLGNYLHTHAIHLSVSGKVAEAVDATEEAVVIRRKLAASDPEQYETDLSLSLHNLAIDLSGCGRNEEAVRATEERITVLRRLVLTQLATYEPALATALHLKALYLAFCNKNADALEPNYEGLEIRRRLASVDPVQFDSALEATLHNICCDLNLCNRFSDTLPYYEELIAVRRRLVVVDPARYQYTLSTALYNYSSLLGDQKRYPEAVEACKEGVDIRRQLAANDRAYEVNLAYSLNQYSWYLAFCPGCETDAVVPGEECVAICRSLAVGDPSMETDLANSLDTLANALNANKRYEEGAVASREGVEIYRASAAGFPDYIAASLLRVYAVALVNSGNREGALEAVREALIVYQRMHDSGNTSRESEHKEATAMFESLSSTSSVVSDTSTS